MRQGLVLAGRDDEVIGLQDNWSQGPIDSDDLGKRLNAVEDALEIEIDADDRGSIEAFWKRALDAISPRIVWFSKWSTMEYCGFLEWLRRNGGRPFTLVDLSDAALPDPRTPGVLYPIQCVSLVREERFADNALWNRAIVPDSRATADWNELWARLRSENAPLRVMTPEGLVSAQVDYFDDDILKHASAEWMFDRYIVGNVLADMMFESFRERGVFQCGDLILFARLRALVEQGALEGLGDPCERDFKVRLPQPTYAATEPTA